MWLEQDSFCCMNFCANVEFTHFSNNFAWWLIAESCFLKEFCLAWNFFWALNLSIPLSITYFACRFDVRREICRRSPKVLSSWSGMIDLKQNSLNVFWLWIIMLWNWLPKNFLAVIFNGLLNMDLLNVAKRKHWIYILRIFLWFLDFSLA